MPEDRWCRGHQEIDQQHQHHIDSPQEIERQVAGGRQSRHGTSRSGSAHAVKSLCDIAPFHFSPSAAMALPNIPPLSPRSFAAPSGVLPFAMRTALEMLFSPRLRAARSEEHTSELQSLMRNSYAGFF